jgi:hypothetical protein
MEGFSEPSLMGYLVVPIFIDSALARPYNRRIKKSGTYDLHFENRLGLTVNV